MRGSPSILRNVPEDARAEVAEAPGVYESPYERATHQALGELRRRGGEAALRRAPHRIVGYAQEVAADFHVFYKHCRVIGVDPALWRSSRLASVSGHQEGHRTLPRSPWV